jgi:hypothetical protein
LALEALGHRRNRRSGGGHRCRGDLLGPRSRPTHRRLHGDRGAIDDESGTLDARRSSSGISTRVAWRWVRPGRGHRGRDLGYRGRDRRRCGAWLPACRSRDLRLGVDRAPSRNMAHVIRDAARSSSGYTWHFGQPWSRVPTASTISACLTSTLRQQRSYPGLFTRGVRGTGILGSSRLQADTGFCSTAAVRFTPSALVHRVAYVLTYGAIPPNTLVLHSCDNPPCVNPRHLRLGTHWDNMEDTFLRGQRKRAMPKPPPKRRTKLSRAQMALAREQHARGKTQSEIARDFGVSQATVSRALRRT